MRSTGKIQLLMQFKSTILSGFQNFSVAFSLYEPFLLFNSSLAINIWFCLKKQIDLYY